MDYGWILFGMLVVRAGFSLNAGRRDGWTKRRAAVIACHWLAPIGFGLGLLTWHSGGLFSLVLLLASLPFAALSYPYPSAQTER